MLKEVILGRIFACSFFHFCIDLSFCFSSPLKNSAFPDDVFDLQSQHLQSSPFDTISSIADSCKTLKIHDFDVYGDYPKDRSTSYLRQFEGEIAQQFGKEDAVFMPSGVMAQNIALLIHSKNLKKVNNREIKNRFACHHTSHLLLWEEDSYSELIGMDVVEISTRIHESSSDFRIPPMGLSDVIKCFNSEKKMYNTNSRLGDTGLSTLIMELPHRELGGKLTPWDEVLAIGDLCKENGIAYHCDGARIFEASAGFNKSCAELAEPFDSIYISFYKGLGAISGAMLMGSKSFTDEARIWLRRFGGNLYTLMPYAISCWAGYRYHTMIQGGSSLTFTDKFDKLKLVTSKIMSKADFEKVATFDPLEPETNMVHVYLKGTVQQCEAIRDQIVETTGLKIFSRIREISSRDGFKNTGFHSKFEWTMGEANGIIDDEKYEEAWGIFIESLLKVLN